MSTSTRKINIKGNFKMNKEDIINIINVIGIKEITIYFLIMNLIGFFAMWIDKKKAEKVYDEIVSEAKSEANLIIERANTEIEREKEKAAYTVRKEAVDLALEISKKIIEKNIDEERNRQLINEFISEVGK